jgi:hypothetical protein
MATRRAKTTSVAGGPASTPPTQGGGVVPFIQASKPEVEPGPSWIGLESGAGTKELAATIPANGFIGGIIIEVLTTTAGEEAEWEQSQGPSIASEYHGATAVSEKGTFGNVKSGTAPFILFEQIRLTEPNGAPIGLELSGWQTALTNIYGGYAGNPDPRNDPDFYSEVKANEFAFSLRLPIEISANALGILGNQSAAASFRLVLKIAPSTIAYKKHAAKAGKSPIFSVKTYVELWGEPPREDIFGRPNKQLPDYAGTAQYWSVQAALGVATAANTIKLTRVGSQIRTLIFEFAETGKYPFGRSDEVAPDPFEIQLDNRIFRQYSRNVLRKLMKEMTPALQLGNSQRDLGVYCLSFNKGDTNLVGGKAISSWLATLPATRLELRGPAEKAGELNVLTNDISVAPFQPSGRLAQVNAGGFHPPVSETSEYAQ